MPALTEVYDNAIMPGTATYLTQPCDSSDVSIQVRDISSMALQQGQFRALMFDPTTGASEYVMVTSSTSRTWTIVRGIENTTPQDFSQWSLIKHVVTAGAMGNLIDSTILEQMIGPRAITISPLGSGQDDAPQLNSYFFQLAIQKYNLSNFHKTIAYLGDQMFNLKTSVSIDSKLVSVLFDGGGFDCRNFVNTVTMTLAVQNGSPDATIVSTSNPSWLPVQSVTVTSAAFAVGSYLTQGTSILAGTPGTVITLSNPANQTGTVSATFNLDAALIVTGSADPEDGSQSWGDSTQFLEGIQMIGPVPFGGTTNLANMTVTSAQQFAAIQMGARNLTGNAGPAHKSMNKGSIRGFMEGIRYQNNGYINTWNNWDIFNCVYGINIPFAISNAGECIKFVGATLFGNAVDVLHSGSGTDTHFIGGSMDYLTANVVSGFPSRKIAVFKGRVYCDHVHMEDNYDGYYWWTLADASCGLVQDSCDWQLANDKSAYELGLCPQTGASGTSVYFAGMYADKCRLTGTNANWLLPTLVAGMGRCNFENISNEAGFVTHNYGGSLGVTGNGILTKSPYAPYTRYNSCTDGSFGVQNTVFMTVTTDLTHGSPNVITVNTPGYTWMPSVGALVLNNVGSTIFQAGTKVTAITGNGSTGSTITLSLPPTVSSGAAQCQFDTSNLSLQNALSYWDFTSSTSTGDQPNIDPTTRATSSDLLQFNSLHFKVGTTGHTANAVTTIACSPGDLFLMSFQIKTANLIANANQLVLSMTYFDCNLNPVDQYGYSGCFQYFYGNNFASFTGGTLYPANVPKNASYIQIKFSASAWNSTSEAWISDLNVTLDGNGAKMRQPVMGSVFGDLSGNAINPTVNTVAGGNRPKYDLGTPATTTGAFPIAVANTLVDVLSVTFTAPPSGKVTLEGWVYSINQLTSGGIPYIEITDASNVDKMNATAGSQLTSNFSPSLKLEWEVTGLTAGNSYTYKLRASTSAGTGQVAAPGGGLYSAKLKPIAT